MANVEVQPVGLGDISQTLPVTGSLMVLNKAVLAPKTTGRLVFLQVREGDRVSRGEVVARLDPTETLANLRQYEANVNAAQVKVEQAKIQYKQSVINTRLAVRTAQSALDAANASLTKIVVGDRPEVKQQTQAQELQQEANFENAQWSYAREQKLYNAGAVSLADLQTAETNYKTQKALLDNYKAALAASQKGGRQEDIDTARETVRQEKLALDNAKANLANAVVNKQAIISYQEQVKADADQVAATRQQLADLNIVSPLNGYVVSRAVDPGQTITAGTTILEVDDLSSTYFQPIISELDIKNMHVGENVDVTLDAYPIRHFQGTVSVIYPSATTTRQFSLRVTVKNPDGVLRPGMYARGEVLETLHKNVIVVPQNTLVRRDPNNAGVEDSGGDAIGGLALLPQKVYLVGSDGKAHGQNVEIGIEANNMAEITSGLKVGDQLVVEGQSQLNDGDAVRVVSAKATK
jgi:HlyD family secretion protein